MTVAFFVSADGGKVGKPIVIWKSKNPQCFRKANATTNRGIIKNFKVKYKKKLLARIFDDRNAHEIANKIDVIQVTEWITSSWKEVSKDITALQNVTFWSKLLPLMRTKMSMKNLTISSKNYLRSCKSMVKPLLTNTLILVTSFVHNSYP